MLSSLYDVVNSFILHDEECLLVAVSRSNFYAAGALIDDNIWLYVYFWQKLLYGYFSWVLGSFVIFKLSGNSFCMMMQTVDSHLTDPSLILTADHVRHLCGEIALILHKKPHLHVCALECQYAPCGIKRQFLDVKQLHCIIALVQGTGDFAHTLLQGA